MDLQTYYAENRRRMEIAHREFAERDHGWSFTLSPDALSWAARQPAPVRDLVRLVERADADDVFRKPEPGTIRSAFASRDPETEVETGAGFGFWPSDAEHLVVHASGAILYADLPALDVYDVLRRVVETFATPRASYQQS
ncbi:hypothetical protein ACIA49_31755 [Kribbella sp. NPDC051587]|uniref:hypothetical protein n=1 Tax=Kribbella sp. NPDC051587 TaxID=3364119 RepID=UPI0037A37159